VCSGSRRADPGVAGRAAAADLQEQQDQAEEHQHARQHVAGGAVERGLELHHDRGGERVKADHCERAVFGQEVEGDQERAAGHGDAQLGEHHPEEGTPGT
jgi:hypothetical protein